MRPGSADLQGIGLDVQVEGAFLQVGGQDAAELDFVADLRVGSVGVGQDELQALGAAGGGVGDDDVVVGLVGLIPVALVIGSGDAEALAQELVRRGRDVLDVGIDHGGAHLGQVNLAGDGRR